jgi:hypothetical protein
MPWRRLAPLHGSGWGMNELKERKVEMDSVTIVRIAAGVLFVVLLIVLIQRRRTRAK